LEYMENGSLASVVKTWGLLPEHLCGTYMAQVLAGLAYLHSKDVIRRDIKGANILLDKNGSVKLADFGSATKVERSENGSRSAKQFSMAGTPYWIAPELIDPDAFPGSPRGDSWAACDMWSLGCTIIELMTGHPPYINLLPIQAMYQIVNATVTPDLPPGSPELNNFLLGCLTKDPMSRLSSAAAVQHEWVHSVLHWEHVSSPPAPSAPAQRSHRRNSREKDKSKSSSDKGSKSSSERNKGRISSGSEKSGSERSKKEKRERRKKKDSTGSANEPEAAGEGEPRYNNRGGKDGESMGGELRYTESDRSEPIEESSDGFTTAPPSESDSQRGVQC